MKHLSTFIIIVVIFICVSYSAPLDNKDNNTDSKSAFGPAFDEIVVESHLTVRRKSNGRQSRTQNVTQAYPTEIVRTKRAIKLPSHQHHHNKIQHPPNLFTFPPPLQFGASAANAQSQAFNSFGPLGSFGASASGAQTQNFRAGSSGIVGTGGFSGTQEYLFNGQKVDIAFGNAFTGLGGRAGGASVTITGPDGKKRPFNG